MESSPQATGDYQFLDSTECPAASPGSIPSPGGEAEIPDSEAKDIGQVTPSWDFLLAACHFWVSKLGWLRRPALGFPALGKRASGGPIRAQTPQSFLCYLLTELTLLPRGCAFTTGVSILPALQNVESKYQKDSHSPAIEELLTHEPGLKTAND